ncbi:HD-GYP domain-containing protein [Bacillus dakarensis]|uniref:HD-GYP domain-containing protein n=1 Tax=Robertmurraya dakarensis TaxID=1926278 RepID=UPI000981F3CB|nr:HD domain-containing phosphohydrolase [Bacillus dakarensis]
MLNTLQRWFYHPKYFRYMFFILFLLSITINGIILKKDGSSYILYIFCAIFLGLGFYNLSPWVIAVLAFMIVVSRFMLIPEPASGAGIFIAYLFTYLLITFITVGLMKNLQKVREDSIEFTRALAKALDSRDAYTMHHSENVATFSAAIAKKMNLSNELCEIIHIGGLLHDIGKIGIPEEILNKPGKLTNEEYNIIKTHPTIGYDIVKHISTFKENGIHDIVLYHHERYDGKGYPNGLKGEKIPLLSRIVAVADAFDAMSSMRVYRKELELDHILNEIRRNKGTQFDPHIVDVFLSLFETKNEKRSEVLIRKE